MTLEDFQAWQEHPVTKWVLKACLKASELNQEHWNAVSWAGNVDPELRLECHTRADAYRAIVETPFERWAEFNGQDTNAE